MIRLSDTTSDRNLVSLDFKVRGVIVTRLIVDRICSRVCARTGLRDKKRKGTGIRAGIYTERNVKFGWRNLPHHNCVFPRIASFSLHGYHPCANNRFCVIFRTSLTGIVSSGLQVLYIAVQFCAENSQGLKLRFI